MLLRAISSAKGADAASLCHCMSQVALAERQTQQALYYADRAAALTPNDPERLVNLANVKWAAGSFDSAIEVAAGAVARFPSNRNSHATYLNFLLRLDRFADVMTGCQLALRHFPTDVQFLSTNATMLLGLGKPEQATALLRGLTSREPNELRGWSAYCPALNYLPTGDAAENLRAHRAFGDLLAKILPPRPAGKGSGPLDPDRPLKVGFMSPDLRSHAMRFFIEPVFENLDTKSFHITCYYTGGQEDEVSARLKSLVPSWKHVPTLHVGHLAELIANDGIDILIDLAGHTRFERLGTMHLRPAPVQMNYIGYPNTTGVHNTDYHITDSLSSPPEQDAAWTERLLRIDPVFFAYKPISDPPPVSALPSASNGFITFGSFNTLMKLNDRVVQTWARVVDRVPGSRLLLKNVQLMQPEARRITMERFVAAGVSPERLDIVGHTGTQHDHLATYSKVDIGLDTFPYAGMTTTLESLLMGVPVVSLAQQSHASRVGMTILHNTGLADLVTQTEDEFVQRATALAADKPRLGSMRQALRSQLLSSVVCDGPSLGKRLGAGLREAWKTHCSAHSSHDDIKSPGQPSRPSANEGTHRSQNKV